MTAIILALLPVLQLTDADAPLPTEAKFIPAEALDYFNGARERQYWGESIEGWHVAIRTVPERQTYLLDGGFGELLPLRATVFTSDSNWEKWRETDDMEFSIAVTAPKRKTLTFKRRLKRDSYSGNSFGSCWSFATDLAMHEVEKPWGALPDSIGIQVSHLGIGSRTITSSRASITLKGLPSAKANLYQRLESLRRGQAKEDILRIVGSPERTVSPNSKDNPSQQFRLEFDNPLAPKDLPSAKRKVWIFIDRDGKYVEHALTFHPC